MGLMRVQFTEHRQLFHRRVFCFRVRETLGENFPDRQSLCISMALLPGWIGLVLTLGITGALLAVAQRLARPLAAIVSPVHRFSHSTPP